MTIFLLLFASVVLAHLAHCAGIAVAGRLAGAVIEEFGLFVGPALLRFKVRGVTLRLNVFPLGSYVRFADGSDEVCDADEHRDPDEDGDPDAPEGPARGRYFKDLAPLTRASIAASGCLTLLALAALCLGPSDAAHKFAGGFAQIIGGPLHPFSTGAHLLSLLAEFVRTHPFAATLGLVAAKLTAFNLLPIPTLNGADILLNLADLLLTIPQSIKTVLSALGIVLVLAWWVSWSVALVHLWYA